MPNWITNLVGIRGENQKKCEEFIDYVKSDSSNFDFEKVIPMPKKLKNTTCHGEVSKEMKENKQLYGYTSWYDFSWEEWGCKWNSSECFNWIPLNKNKTSWKICFRTPWDSPMKVLQKLKEMFPKIEIFRNEQFFPKEQIPPQS